MRVAAVAIALAVLACRHTAAPPDEPAPKSKPKPKPHVSPTPAPECATDDDCVLLPELNCCGECAAAPPFDAITRAELDAALMENDSQCAADDWDCDLVRCVAPPPGCDARAACTAGQCVVASTGC